MSRKYVNGLIGAALCLAAAFPVHAEEITGPATVIEGDLFEINGRRIRLYGIDAPEADQICLSKKGEKYPCGDHAMRHVTVMVGRMPLTCKGETEDEHGNLIAVCQMRFLDINEYIVIEGWALAYREHGEEYVRAETAARARRSGLWRGSTFVMPWEWRAGKR